MRLRKVEFWIAIVFLVAPTNSSESDSFHEIDDEEDYEEGTFDKKNVLFIREENDYTTEHSVAQKTRDVYQVTSECPPLPEPTIENARLCQVTKCQTNQDCLEEQNLERMKEISNKICCFNGCVHTCMTQVDPPPVFDWIEETNLRNLSEPTYVDETQLLEIESSSNKQKLLEHKEAEVTIAIPGGCMISSKQYKSLLSFRNNKYINSCICVNKDIVCNITQEHE